jgi:peptidoglycan/LPS O-acetylase OafA/YrhL
MQVIFTTQLPGTLDAFGIGIALALLTIKSRSAGLNLLLPMWRNCLIWLTLALGILWLAGSIFLPVGNYWANTGIIVFWRTTLALGFGAALAAVITCPVQGSSLLKPLRYLGEISYGIYLWHFPILLTLLSLPGLRGGRLFLVLLFGSILLASLSWHLLEKHWARPPK